MTKPKGTKKAGKAGKAEDQERGKGLFSGSYPLNEKGCLSLARDMQKAGLANSYKQDRAWIWIDIPKKSANKIQAIDVPAFRVFFEKFSPSRGQWFSMGRSAYVLAERAAHYNVALSSDGSAVLNEYDMQAEGIEHTLVEAEKKAKGEKNTWPQLPKKSPAKVDKKLEKTSTEDLIENLKRRGVDVSALKVKK
jgi:hypothetical protein